MSAHAAADEHRNDPAALVAVLGPLVTDAPPSDASAQLSRALRQDAAFRLALAELGRGQAHAALQWADRGLAVSSDESVESTNLHIARGRALAELGRAVEAADAYLVAQSQAAARLDALLTNGGAAGDRKP
jgi:hypothetical protein